MRLLPFLMLLSILMLAHAGPHSFQHTNIALPEWDAAKETIVIYNQSVPESVDLATYYAKARNIPAEHLVGLNCSGVEQIKRQEFNDTIVRPLLEVMKKRQLWDIGKVNGENKVIASRIRILAIMYGVPLKIERTNSPKNPYEVDEASVDSSLTLLPVFTKLPNGAVHNPYFNQDQRFNTISGLPLLLTARLDGPSPQTVRRMIDDGLKAEKTGLYGKAYVDLWGKTDAYQMGDDWLREAIRLYAERGITPVVESTPNNFVPFYPMNDAILYFGWYTQDVNGPFENPNFRFKPGAVACHLHSFSAATLRQSKVNWTGPLLERGAAAVLGNVWEPYLHMTTHLDVFNERLLRGYTLAEAHWMATPALDWMNIVAGDPLYRPFAVQTPKTETTANGTEHDYAWLRKDAIEKNVHLPEPDQSKSTPWPNNLSIWRDSLVKIAEKANSPYIFEYTGWLYALDASYGQASDCFQHAAVLYKLATDKLRCNLDIVEMQVRQGLGLTAVVFLKKTFTQFQKTPESAAAMAMINTLAPPAPPTAPLPVKRD